MIKYILYAYPCQTSWSSEHGMSDGSGVRFAIADKLHYNGWHWDDHAKMALAMNRETRRRCIRYS